MHDQGSHLAHHMNKRKSGYSWIKLTWVDAKAKNNITAMILRARVLGLILILILCARVCLEVVATSIKCLAWVCSLRHMDQILGLYRNGCAPLVVL